MKPVPRDLPQRTVFVLVALLTFAAMANSLSNGFAYDDVPAIAENALFRTGAAPWRYLTEPYWSTEGAGLLWRPLTVAMFGLQYAIRADAWLFHLVNALLAAAATTLLTWVTLRLTTPLRALAVGALFATMPVHTEVTANVTGQAELWCLIGTLGAAIVWLSAPDTLHPDRRRALLMLCVVASAAAKEQGFMTPLILGLLEWLRPDGPRARNTVLRDLAPSLVALGLLIVARLVLLEGAGGGPAIWALADLSMPERALVMLGLVPRMILLFIWPTRLLADYNPGDVSVVPAFGEPQFTGLALLLMAAGLVRISPTWKGTAALVGGALAAFAPVANIGIISGVVFAERHLFIPSAFLLLAVAVGLPELEFGRMRTALIGLVCAAVVLGLSRTWQRNPEWASTETIIGALRRDAPSNYRGLTLWARLQLHKGQPDSTEALLRQALSQFKGDPRVYEDLGQIIRVRYGCVAALPILQRGLRIDPTRVALRAKAAACTEPPQAPARVSDMPIIRPASPALDRTGGVLPGDSTARRVDSATTVPEPAEGSGQP